MGSQNSSTNDMIVVGGSMNPQAKSKATKKATAAGLADGRGRGSAQGKRVAAKMPVATVRDSRRGGMKFAADAARVPFVPAPGAPDLGTWPLAHAVDHVVTQMRALAHAGNGSPATAEKYADVLRRFALYAAALGIDLVADVTVDVVRGFIFAPLPSGRGRSPVDVGKAPASGTAALRRSAIATMFRGLRADGITDLHPVTTIPVGAQKRSRLRPATPRQISQICGYAESYGASTFGAGLIALMLSGASTAEAAYVSVADVDLDEGTVRLPGSGGRYQERIVALDSWERSILTARIATINQEFTAASNTDAIADWPVAFRRPASQFKHNHVSQNAGEYVRDIITRSGLDVTTSGLTPMSITQYAVNRVYALTGSVEQVAAMYGIKDLNAARRLISDTWQEEYGVAVAIPSVAGDLAPRPAALTSVGGAR